MPSIDIPQEVVDLIVDNLQGDTENLRRCSFVSLSFLHSSRRHLFASITISSAAQCKRLYAVLSSSPEIVTKIKILHIIDSYWVLQTVTSVFRLLANCGTLEEFHIEHQGRRNPLPRFPNCPAVRALLTSPRLTSVTVDGFPFCKFQGTLSCLVNSPSLQHLAFTKACNNSTCRMALLHFTKCPPTSSPSHIHSLDARCDHSSLLRYQLRDSLSQLRTLYLWIFPFVTANPTGFSACPINLQDEANLRLVVFQLRDNLCRHCESLAKSRLPPKIEHLVLVISQYTLYKPWLNLTKIDESLAAMLSPANAYPRLQRVYFAIVISPDDHRIAEQVLDVILPFTRAAGPLRCIQGTSDEIEAVLEGLETPMGRTVRRRALVGN